MLNFRGVFFTYINSIKKELFIFISKKHASKLGLFDVFRLNLKFHVTTQVQITLFGQNNIEK